MGNNMDNLRFIVLISFFICCIIIDIIYIIIRISKLFICRNIEDCRNRRCPVNGACKKYNEALTQEEYNYIKKLLKTLSDKEST